MSIGRNSILLRVEALLGLELDLLGRVHILAEVEVVQVDLVEDQVDIVEEEVDTMEVQEQDIREEINPPD